MIRSGDEMSQHPAWKQQRLLPGQRAELAELAAWTSARRAFLEFVREAHPFPKAHPNLHRHKFFQGHAIHGSAAKDIVWLRADGKEMTDEEWDAGWMQTLGVRLDGRGLDVVDRERGACRGRHPAAAAQHLSQGRDVQAASLSSRRRAGPWCSIPIDGPCDREKIYFGRPLGSPARPVDAGVVMSPECGNDDGANPE